MFVKRELIDWESFVERFGPVFRDGVGDELPTEVFQHTEKGDERWEDFRKRTVEHVGCNGFDCHVCLFLLLCFVREKSFVFGKTKYLQTQYSNVLKTFLQH